MSIPPSSSTLLKWPSQGKNLKTQRPAAPQFGMKGDFDRERSLHLEADNIELLKARLNHPQRQKSVPDMAAVIIRHTNKPEVVELVARKMKEELPAGVNTPIDNNDGSSMLHILVDRGKPNLVEKLMSLELGADPNLENMSRETAFSLARQLKSDSIQASQQLRARMREVLEKKFAKPAVQQQQSAPSQSLPVIPRSVSMSPYDNPAAVLNTLVQHPNQLDQLTANTLYRTNSPDVIRILAGAMKARYDGNVDAQKLFYPILNLSMLNFVMLLRPDPKLAEALIGEGANPNLRDRAGWHAFDRANWLTGDKKKQMMEILSKNGTIQPDWKPWFHWVPSIQDIKVAASTKISNALTYATSWLPAMPSLSPTITNVPAKPLHTFNKPQRTQEILDQLPSDEMKRIAFNAIQSSISPEVVRIVVEKVIAEPDNLEGLKSEDVLRMLHKLVQRGKPDLVNVLIDMGADPKQRDASGRNAFDWMRELKAETPEATRDLKRQMRKVLSGQNGPDTDESLMQELHTRLADVTTRFDALHKRQQTREQRMADELSLMSTMKHDVELEKQALASDLQATQERVKTQQGHLEKAQKELKERKKLQLEESNTNEFLSGENHKLQKALKEAQAKAEQEQKDLKAAVAEEKKKHAALQRELKQSQATAQDRKSSLESLKVEKETLRGQLRKSEEGQQKALEKAAEASLQKHQQELVKQKTLHNEQTRGLESKNQELQKALNDKRAENDQLHEQLTKLQQANQELQAKLSTTNMKLAKHVIDHAQVQEGQFKSQALEEQLQRAVQETEEAKQAAKQEIEALKQLQEQARLEADQKVQHSEALQAALEQVKQAKETVDREANEAKHEILELRRQLQDARASVDLLQGSSQFYEERTQYLTATLNAWQAKADAARNVARQQPFLTYQGALMQAEEIYASGMYPQKMYTDPMMQSGHDYPAQGYPLHNEPVPHIVGHHQSGMPNDMPPFDMSQAPFAMNEQAPDQAVLQSIEGNQASNQASDEETGHNATAPQTQLADSPPKRTKKPSPLQKSKSDSKVINSATSSSLSSLSEGETSRPHTPDIHSFLKRSKLAEMLMTNVDADVETKDELL